MGDPVSRFARRGAGRRVCAAGSPGTLAQRVTCKLVSAGLGVLLIGAPALVATGGAASATTAGFTPVGLVTTPANAPAEATVPIANVAPPTVVDPNAVAPSGPSSSPGVGEPDAGALAFARLSPGDEIVSRRSEYSKVFKTANPGVLRVQASMQPVHYQLSDGTWAEIDPTLRALTSGWQSGGGLVTNEISSASSGQLADVVLPGGQRVGWKLEGRLPSAPVLVPATGPAMGPLPQMQLNGPVTVRVPSVLTGVDEELTSTNVGLKDDLVLATATAPTSYVFDVHLEGLTARLGATNGAVELIDSQGAVKALMPPAFMVDSSGVGTQPPARSYGATYALSGSGADVQLTLTLDSAWLSDPARVFPVRVDPILYMDSLDTEDTYVMSTNTTNHSAYAELSTGYDPYEGGGLTRTLLRFNYWGNIFPNHDATALSASIYVYADTSNACSGTVQSYAPGTQWDQNTVTWSSPLSPSFVSSMSPPADPCPVYRQFNGWAGYVTQWIQNGANYGAELIDSPEAQGYWHTFVSREHACCVSGPYIDGQYSQPPSFSNLAPTSGSTVALTPVLSGTFSDPTYDQGFIRYRLYDSTGANLLGTYDGPTVSSGQTSSITVPSGVLTYNTNYVWTAQAYANATYTNTTITLTSPVSSQQTFTTQALNAVTATVSASQTEAAAGMQVTITAAMNNSNGVGVNASFTGNVPTGWAVVAGTGRLDGNACSQCSSNVTAFSASNLSFGAFGSHTVTFVIQPLRSLLECVLGNLTWTVSTSGTSASSNGAVPLSGCGTGLGLESWWSFESRALGPQATASVNVANGNLVVQQVDTTPVQGHGRLAYVLRRTYNSQAPETLPVGGGGLRQGWTLNVTEAGDTAGLVDGSGLVVPAISDAVTAPAVVLVDRDGTRHLFTPSTTSVDTQLSSPLVDLLKSGDISPGSLLQGLNDAIARTGATPLTLATAKICVDTTYTPPPGVHLALWRYVAVSSGASCVGAGPTTNPAGIVLGYGTMRPDRVRQVFDITGRLQSMFDAAGNELRYRYDTTNRLTYVYEPAACSDPTVGTCREFSFTYGASDTTVTDPAGRKVKYARDGGGNLVQVTTTAATHVAGLPDTLETWNYDMASNCGQPSGTTVLCGVQSPNSFWTRFTYQTEAHPRIATIAERWSAADPGGPSQADLTSTFTYNSRPATQTNVVRGQRQVRYDAIDGFGRVAERYEASPAQIAAGTALKRTSYTWDVAAVGSQAAVTCRPVDNQVDNNLCQVTHHTGTVDGTGAPAGWTAAGDDVTQYAYNPEGNTLFQRRAIGAGWLTTTYGYQNTYTKPDGTTVAADDTVTGPATFNSTARPTGALFAVSDKVAQRDPRDLTTTWTVDRNPAVKVGLVGTGANCGSGNSGLTCRQDAPESATTAYQYDNNGQLTTRRTPNGGTYTYTYYVDSTDHDMSNSVTAGGWLKFVTDPTGAFVAFAYDRAGNVMRTWDRNATHGHLTSEYPGPIIGGPGWYRFALHNWGGDGEAAPNPWRYVITQGDQLGNYSNTTRDLDGNPILIHPPRGTTTPQTTMFDVTQTFTVRDELSTKVLPATPTTPWQWRYDEAGNQTAAEDPNGQFHTTVYDAANRKIEERSTRGDWWGQRTPTLEAQCRQSTGTDAPIAAGKILCWSATTYDGADRAVTTRDPAGALTWTTFDQTGRATDIYAPRSTGVWLHTVKVYDPNGNVTFDCGPRQAAEEANVACGPGAHFSTANTYDNLNRLTGTTRYRQTTDTTGQIASGWTPLTTGYGYDPDGNQTSSTDPDGHTTVTTFDLLDRKTLQQVPRVGSTVIATEWDYSPAGDLTAMVVAPGTADQAITAYSYDGAHQPKDTVVAATSRDANDPNMTPSAPGQNPLVNLRTRTLYDREGHVVGRYSPRAFTNQSSFTTPNVQFLTQIDYDPNGRPIAQWQPIYDLSDTNFQPNPSDAQVSECPVPGPDHQPFTGTGTPGYNNAPGGTTSTIGLCVTRSSYDFAGNLVTVRNPTGARITSHGAGADNADHPENTGIYNNPNRYIQYQYSNDNLVAQVSGPNPAVAGGRVTTAVNQYDGAGRLTASLDAANYETDTTWTADGLTAATEGRTSGATTVDHQVTTTYNTAGQPLDTNTRIDAGRTDTTTTDYYSDGTTHQVNQGTGTGNPNLQTRYGYDNNGNATTVWSPSAVARDATNPGGQPATNTYTFDNLLLTATQPVSTDGTTTRQTSYGYDQRGNKTAVGTTLITGGTPTDGGTQTFIYNPDDSLSSERGRAAGGGQVDHFWLADGAPFTTNNTSGGVITSTNDTYWLNGTLRGTITNSGATGFPTTSERFAYHADGTQEFRQSYNGFVLDAQQAYIYNDARALTGVTATGGGVGTDTWAITYDPAGRPNTLVDPVSRLTAYTIRADGQLTDRQLFTGNAINTAPLAHDRYTYDGANRILTQELPQAVGAGGGTTNTNTFTYTYDAAGRVKSFTPTTGGTPTPISYDANSNRTSDGTTNYDYRPDNTIADAYPQASGPASAKPSTYDAVGRLTSDPCRDNTYDGLDRLTASTFNNGRPGCGTGDSTTYTYDGFDRQTARAVNNQNTYLQYWGHDQTLLSETAPVAANTARYITTPSGQPLAATNAASVPVTQFINADGTGSTGTITSSDTITAANAVTCTLRYNPWGDPIGGTSTNPCTTGTTFVSTLYQQGRRDTSTGTYQWGNRSYDPRTANWLTPDNTRGNGAPSAKSIGTDPLTANTYSYVNGDPINLKDPTGHAFFDTRSLMSLRNGGHRPIGALGLGSTFPINDALDAPWTLSLLGQTQTITRGQADALNARLGGASWCPVSREGNVTYWNGEACGYAYLDYPGGFGQQAANFGGGFLNFLTLGNARRVLSPLGQDNKVDYSSGAFHVGEATAIAINAALAINSVISTVSAVQAARAGGATYSEIARSLLPLGRSSAGEGGAGGIEPVLQGQAGVERSIAAAEARGESVIGREVTMETTAGRTRPDLLVRDAEGNLKFIESKNGPFARLTPNQSSGFPLLESEGGIPRGLRAFEAGLTPGEMTGPIPVQIDWWGL